MFAQFAPAYWERGLPVIPLRHREKRPAIDAWQMFSEQMPTPEQQARWLHEHPHGNMGLVLGAQADICILDVDTDDPKVHAMVESILPVSPWRRLGRKGFATAYRWNGQRTFRIKKADDGGVMELLSSKTQVVLPPSIHPDTGRAYVANCELLDVLDNLPSLPRDVEILLREGLKEIGYELSHSGYTKLTDWVAPGARDNRMVQVAGMYANSICRAEVTFMEAVQQMRGWHEARVEKVAGDDIDIDKGLHRLAEYLIADVTGEKRRMLPPGWDAGLDEATRAALKLDVLTADNEDQTPDQVRTNLEAVLATLGPDDLRRVDEVNKTLDRIARSRNMDSLIEENLLRWIADTSMAGLTLTALKRRLRELRQGEIIGTDHSEIADQVLADLARYGEVRFQFGKFWQWNGSHWANKDESEIYRLIADSYGSLPAARKANDHAGIVKTMGRKVTKPLVDTPLVGINFANGFLTQDGQLLQHSAAYGCTYTLPYRYLPELADRCFRWMEFLNDRWAGDDDREQKIIALQKAMCATLLGMAPKLQRAVLLIGAARSGKSQVLKIMRGLLPPEAICNIPPDTWGDKFMPAGFIGKLLNVAGELSETKLIAGDKFKAIVEGEEINVQFKGKDPFDLRPRCAHWFASNHLPKTRDTSDGFNRRWLVLTFSTPVSLDAVQLDFGDILIAEEREAIASWAIQAMPRLVRQQGYTLPLSHARAVEDMADANDSVRFFMRRSNRVKVTDVGRDGKTSPRTLSNQLYVEYFRYCSEAGDARPVGLRTFLARMNGMQNTLGFRELSIPDQNDQPQVWYENVMLVTA